MFNGVICWFSGVFCNDTATTDSYTDGHTLALHDALPIFAHHHRRRQGALFGNGGGGACDLARAGSSRHPPGRWAVARGASCRCRPASGRDGMALHPPPEGIEPLLGQLIAGGEGIDTLSIERPSLHDAFVAIVGRRAREHESHSAIATSAPDRAS